MALLLLLAFVLSAQDKPPAQCSLSGTVVNSVTGEPLNKVDLVLEAAERSSRSEGTAAAGATVVLAPEPNLRARSDLFKTSTTDQNGHFEFTSVAPGEYKVFAWDDVEPWIWNQSEAVRSIAPQRVQGVGFRAAAGGAGHRQHGCGGE